MTTPVLVLIDDPAASASGTFRAATDPDRYHVVDYDTGAVNAMDLGITRGDGIFETVGIYEGRVHAVDAHLSRFANSARILELPAPDAAAYRHAVSLGISLLGDVPDAYCKYVLTRGIESRPSSSPTGYAFLDVNPDWTAARTSGISIVTLTRGYALDIAQTAPWLLQGAKTLSYAVNRAVLREAARREADDVLFTTTDGYVLEGPTSSVVLRFGDHFVTPTPERGVLAGTAQLGFFDFCASRGLPVSYRPVELAELAAADQLWMTNSQRLAAPVRMLDGEPRTIDAAFTAAVNAYLVGRLS